MTTHRTLIATALAAFALGISAGAVIQAQQARTPRAYVIAEVNVKDANGFKPYADGVPGIIKAHGGEYIVRGGKTFPLEGAPPASRVAVIAFDSVEKARAWYDSPEYVSLRAIRHATADSRSFIAEGVSPAP